MIYWAVVFMVVAVIAAIFGFTGIALAAAWHSEAVVLRFPGPFSSFAPRRIIAASLNLAAMTAAE